MGDQMTERIEKSPFTHVWATAYKPIAKVLLESDLFPCLEIPYKLVNIVALKTHYFPMFLFIKSPDCSTVTDINKMY